MKRIAIITNSEFINKYYEEYADIYILNLNEKQKKFLYKNIKNNIISSLYSIIIKFYINIKNSYRCFENQNELFDYLFKLDYEYVILHNFSIIINQRNIKLMNNKILNIHPSYLPYFPGRNPIIRSIHSSKSIGLTLHIVTKDIDKGAIIYQNYLDNTNYFEIEKIRNFYNKENLFILEQLDNLIINKKDNKEKKLELDNKFKEYSLNQPTIIQYIERIIIYLFIICALLILTIKIYYRYLV